MDITLTTLMTEQGVAEAVSLSLATVRRWRLLGHGPAFIKLGSAVRYRPEDVSRWVASRPVAGGELVDVRLEVAQ